jgi:hypothetical protein
MSLLGTSMFVEFLIKKRSKDVENAKKYASIFPAVDDPHNANSLIGSMGDLIGKENH